MGDAFRVSLLNSKHQRRARRFRSHLTFLNVGLIEGVTSDPIRCVGRHNTNDLDSVAGTFAHNGALSSSEYPLASTQFLQLNGNLAPRRKEWHNQGMQKRSSKTLKDVDEIATFVVPSSAGAPNDVLPIEPDSYKNPAAVDLGRLGGLKRGKARAASLTEAERKEREH